MSASKPGPVVHFEMPCEDRQRMAAFYQRAFGWRAEMLGEPMAIPGVGQYVAFHDTERNRVSMLQPIPHNWHAPKQG